MSVLSTIREKSTLLLIIIGGALVAFILGDVLSSGERLFSSNSNNIGEIAGQTISAQEFEQRLQKMEENYRLNTGSSSIDESTRESLRQQAWNQALNEIIMEEEYRGVGIKVTSQELYELVAGSDPHPTVQRAFSDPSSGTFDKNRVLSFLKTMDEDPSGATKIRWIEFERGIKQERMNEKYNDLIKKGLYIPTKLAHHEYLAKQKNASLQYVVKRYSEITDSEITFNEDDLKKYHKEHQKEFDQEKSRKIEFVVFDVVPSKEDLAKAEKAIMELKDDFAASIDDSSFIKMYSDGGLQIEVLGENQLPAELVELFHAEKGSIKGPYKEEQSFKIAKVVDQVFVPDSVRARHILIPVQEGNTEAALAKADSLKKLIKGGKKFAEMAEKHSEDFGSAAKGGDLEWFTEGTMVKPFNDAVFYGKKGDMPIVVSQFGVHLIEITGRSTENKRVKFAFIEKNIEAGPNTFQDYYIAASEFANKNKSLEAFDKAVSEKGLNKRIADNIKPGDRMIAGVEQSRELVRWAFKEKQGSISKPFEFEDKFIVASLVEVREEGVASLDQVKEQVEKAVIKEKKAEKLMQELNTALASSNSIEEVATKVNAKSESADNINFSSFSIPGIGREPKIVGTAFGIQKDVISSPVKGETGVFVIKVTAINSPAEITDYSEHKNKLSSNLTNRVGYEAFEALKENAKVTDNRYKFY
ncbi:MAG: SurA N-terminal domain-containing protein [Bacteroidetes bacterium]|nr:SurA N-terminal domain-containing protein [Bacteroidota bacterium]HET6243466.1 SurA N-terminal domain-containing protein [Bacteroidia bacterium]